MHLPKWATSFGAQVIYGLIVGLILGFIAAGMGDGNPLAETLSWVGTTYVKLLKLLIPPLVFTAVVTSVSNLRKVTNAARLAVQTLVWFAITSFFSVIIGILVGLVVKPGVNSTVDAANAAEPSSTGSWMGFLNSVVPANIFGITAKVNDSGVAINFNVLQILVISMLLGIAAVKVGEAAEGFIRFNESLLKVVQEVLWWVIRLAPIGTAALIGNAVVSYGWDALGSLGKFVLAIYIGLALVLFVLYPAVLAAHKIPVAEFFKRVWPVTTLGFATRSSMGTMPVTQRTTEQAMGVPSEYASFAIPLGATTKMDGCASIYPAVAAIFVAQFYGVQLSVADYALIVIVSVLGSAATAGTTGATVMLTLTLSTLGLPLAGVGLLLAVDPIIDMGRTAVNVTGQSVVATVVAKREGIIDERAWTSAERDLTDRAPELARS